MKKYTLLLLWSISAATGVAQGYFQDHKLPIYAANGLRLRNALAGGMAAPQFSQADLNGDGWPELVVFEREDSSFSVYRNLGRPSSDTWRYDPALSAIFADCPCRAWALLRDYNHDGWPDVFCSNQQGHVLVYKQLRPNGQPSFVPAIMPLTGDYRIGVPVRLYVPNTDLPAITDVDNDGDLDILTFNGTDNVMEYHRNVADSLFPGKDTMVMFLATICWGKFSESAVDNNVRLLDPAQECQALARPAGPNHVAGSTILALDLDNDNDQDLILGDEGENYVLGLYNHGTPLNATMGQVESPFPSANPILITNYVGVFQADANNDGNLDLISSPAKYRGVENYNAVTLHGNTGTTAFPVYASLQKGFLQNTTLDVGDMAAPAFLHLNNDSLPDLLIGSYGYYQPGNPQVYSGGKLMAFLNTGTAQQPAFTLTDSNFLNLPGISLIYQEASPTAGDLDDDGDQDLVVGAATGGMLFLQNNGVQGQLATFSPNPALFAGIDVGDNAAPCLYDLDADGDLDLLAGNKAGYIWLYRNTGTKTSPVWTLESQAWGKVKMNQLPNAPTSQGYARPVIADHDGDGTPSLLVGEVNGTVQIFAIGNAPTDSFLPTGKLFGVEVGRRAAPAAAVLDTSGNLTWVVGNQRGGLHIWRTQQIPEVDTLVQLAATLNAPAWTVAPNPAATAARLAFPDARARQVSVTDATGRIIYLSDCQADIHEINLSAIPVGYYLVRVAEAQGVSTRRLSVQR